MHLLGLMHVCDLKENTSSIFLKYNKNIILIAKIELIHMDTYSWQIITLE